MTSSSFSSSSFSPQTAKEFAKTIIPWIASVTKLPRNSFDQPLPQFFRLPIKELALIDKEGIEQGARTSAEAFQKHKEWVAKNVKN